MPFSSILSGHFSKSAYFFALVHVLWSVHYTRLDLKPVLVVGRSLKPLSILGFGQVDSLVRLETGLRPPTAECEGTRPSSATTAPQGGSTQLYTLLFKFINFLY